MYTLQVFYAEETTSRQTIRVERAADVLNAIPAIIAQHCACDRLVVSANGVKLFAVDCEGNRLDD